MSDFQPLSCLKDQKLFKSLDKASEYILSILGRYDVSHETLSLVLSLCNLIFTRYNAEIINRHISEEDISFEFYTVKKGFSDSFVKTDYTLHLEHLKEKQVSLFVDINRKMFFNSSLDGCEITLYENSESLTRELEKPLISSIFETLDMVETRLCNQISIELRDWLESNLCKKTC